MALKEEQLTEINLQSLLSLSQLWNWEILISRKQKDGPSDFPHQGILEL